MFNNRLSKLKNFIRTSNINLSDADRERLIRLIKPTIGVVTRNLHSEVEMKVGNSKIGGSPDLPKSIDWPSINGIPLVFCAQYNLAEITKFDREKVLPKKGMIYVFVSINEEWNEFSFESDKAKIFYIEDVTDIERKEFPVLLIEERKIKQAEICYFETYTIPDDENFKLFYFKEKYEHFSDNSYQEIQNFLNDNDYHLEDNLHQILGEDRSVQSSVVYDFASNELKIHRLEEYTERKNEILELSKNYRLLIQLDCSDFNTDLSRFGGSGVFYIGIREDNLLKKDFQNLSISFQMT